MGCLSVIVGFLCLLVGAVLLVGGFLGTAAALFLASVRAVFAVFAAVLRALF